MAFQDELSAWYTKNARDLPWRNTTDPYKIWLSEVILQQTRVEQGLPYYHRFITAYPVLKKLAMSSEEEVLRLWQGLGYYSRGRNLLAAARQMMERHGRFPETYNDIRALKGIGDYTAAAIASFAYNLPHAVVDGNVYRFYSRLFGISTPIDSSSGKKEFAALAQELLNKRDPGLHNQAVMEMGATVCKPKPDCPACPFSEKCMAFRENKISSYPVKSKQTAVRDRHFYYLIYENKNALYIKKREEKDIWQGLYDFPLIETGSALEPKELYKLGDWKKQAGKAIVRDVQGPYIHKLSHQTLYAHFIHLESTEVPPGCKAVKWKDLDKYGMPQLVVKYLKQLK